MRYSPSRFRDWEVVVWWFALIVQGNGTMLATCISEPVIADVPVCAVLILVYAYRSQTSASS